MVTAGLNHSAALLADGSVIAWGGNAKGQAKVTTDVRYVKTISAGNLCTMVLKQDGTVFDWADNAATKSHCRMDSLTYFLLRRLCENNDWVAQWRSDGAR